MQEKIEKAAGRAEAITLRRKIVTMVSSEARAEEKQTSKETLPDAGRFTSQGEGQVENTSE